MHVCMYVHMYIFAMSEIVSGGTLYIRTYIHTYVRTYIHPYVLHSGGIIWLCTYV